jgi:hypothetical protein
VGKYGSEERSGKASFDFFFREQNTSFYRGLYSSTYLPVTRVARDDDLCLSDRFKVAFVDLAPLWVCFCFESS